MVPNQAQAGQNALSQSAAPTPLAGLPTQNDAEAAADMARPTRQPDGGLRSRLTRQGRPAAPSQPAEGPGPAKVANAGEQAGPGGQGSADVIGVGQDCASILQCAEAGALMLVQGGAEPAEADSANQQKPPDRADSASAKTTDALTAAPAARAGIGSQQGPAEFQKGAHSGTWGPAVACSEPHSGLPAAIQGRAPSAATAAGDTQSGVPVAEGSVRADADHETTMTASKVSYWSPRLCLHSS